MVMISIDEGALGKRMLILTRFRVFRSDLNV